MERDIVKWIGARGPSTGLEIKKEIDADSLLIWKTCKTSRDLQVRTLGRRYLRLDRHVEGYARLSPSILREFLTYSVIGLADHPELLEKRCREVTARIQEISRLKLELTRQMVAGIMEEFEEGRPESQPICFILAGDIVYDMAHDVPRPEHSTGRLVRGSDIDLVVVVEDDFPDAHIRRLDEVIYRKKYRMLINPAVNEEVDYKIKKLSRVIDQARFEDFKQMVAIKILQEGMLIYGSRPLFEKIKKIIREKGLAGKLDELERLAEKFRDRAERAILRDPLDREKIKELHLFYSAEEFEEFE